MNIYTRLKQDHDEHRKIAKKISGTSADSEERRQLWATFKREVVAHANAEEQVFYAALFEEPDTQEQARHSVSEHKEADDLIQELDDMDMSSSGWIQKFEKLQEALEHHMTEEENEVFAQAKKVLNDSQERQQADDFETRKRQELDRA